MPTETCAAAAAPDHVTAATVSAAKILVPNNFFILLSANFHFGLADRTQTFLP
jgi:hypothetical protein